MWESSIEDSSQSYQSDSPLDYIEQAKIIAAKARELYPDGILIEGGFSLAKDLTQKAINERPLAIFKGCFEADDISVRPDILVRGENDDWDIIRVKSKKTPDKQYLGEGLDELAVQVHVVRQHLKIRNVKLKHLCDGYDNENIASLFTEKDLTAEIDEAVEDFAARRASLQELLADENAPPPVLTYDCRKCPFFGGCWSDLPEHNIFHLPRFGRTKTENAIAEGKLSLDDIDPGILTPKQLPHWKSYKEKKPIIDQERLQSSLDELIYPIHYLDFESLNPRIPAYEDLKPSGHYPFQYSLHIEKENGELDHFGFLDPSLDDPRPSMARKLLSEIHEKGSIVSHHASFEIKMIKQLASVVPELEMDLLNLLPRFWDTEKVISRGIYIDSRLKGSSSIKVVLPVLVGEKYEGLDIQDGSNAQSAYAELLRSKSFDKATLESLKEYCKKDTEAMYLIVGKLRSLIS